MDLCRLVTACTMHLRDKWASFRRKKCIANKSYLANVYKGPTKPNICCMKSWLVAISCWGKRCSVLSKSVCSLLYETCPALNFTALWRIPTLTVTETDMLTMIIFHGLAENFGLCTCIFYETIFCLQCLPGIVVLQLCVGEHCEKCSNKQAVTLAPHFGGSVQSVIQFGSVLNTFISYLLYSQLSIQTA